jgi:hypothetical protein
MASGFIPFHFTAPDGILELGALETTTGSGYGLERRATI